MKYHVTFYYLASGMEGHADRRDYGIVEAKSEKDAKCKAIGAQWPDADDATKSFVLSCLTAKPVASKAAPVGEREAFERAATSHRVEGIGFNISRVSGGAYKDNETRMLYEGWKLARAAYQRAQQPQSAEAVAWTHPRHLAPTGAHVFESTRGRVSDAQVPLYTTPQPSAGVVMPERQSPEDEWHYVMRERSHGWNACLDEFARLNGKEVGRG